MAQQFPKMVPTTRSFTMGDFPSTTYRSMSGAIFKRSFGNVQTGYKLELVFKNIGDVDELRSGSGTALAIVDHYNNVSGTFQGFNLPAQVFGGTKQGLTAEMRKPAKIQWRYAKPPKIQVVYKGVSTVTVSLTGEIHA